MSQRDNSLTWRWDVGTLDWVRWDGSLTTGALTIGSVKVTDGTDTLLINADGSLPTTVTASAATVSTVNSSTTPLGIGGVFTGIGELTDTYASITVFVFSDKASATDGLSVQFSQDNTNWDSTSSTTITANLGIAFILAPTGRYFRIVYTNGGTAQTIFRLQIKFHPVALSPVALPLSKALTADVPAIVTHGIISGVTTAGGGTFVDVKVSPSGAVQIGATDFDIRDLAFATDKVDVSGWGCGQFQIVAGCSWETCEQMEY